jgi:hypothetical protein
MIYLDTADLTTDSYQRFIDESTADDPTVIERSELVAIGITKTMLKGRYDVALIFDETVPLRDEYLVEIIVKLTMYKIIGRNAARKVPQDVKDDHTWAMKELKEINAGKITLELPIKTDADGNPSLKPMFGNNTNPDFYI